MLKNCKDLDFNLRFHSNLEPPSRTWGRVPSKKHVSFLGMKPWFQVKHDNTMAILLQRTVDVTPTIKADAYAAWSSPTHIQKTWGENSSKTDLKHSDTKLKKT